MQKFSYYILTLVITVSILPSCASEKNKDKNSNALQVKQVKPFSVGDYNFSILENNKFIQYNKAIYQRGDEVFIVLEQVGPFARGRDSLNHAEMRLEVTDAIGEIITIRENLFGARGHGNFKNNMLKAPYASYVSDLKDKPGKYTISVIVYDLIKKDSIVVSDDFFLE